VIIGLRPTQASSRICGRSGGVAEAEGARHGPGKEAAMPLLKTGRITFLRAHDVGTGFGPPDDFIDVEIEDGKQNGVIVRVAQLKRWTL
jgi:hypothetical protein